MILFAEKHGMRRLGLTAASFMDNNFEMVFTTDEFIELQIDDLLILLHSLIYDQLNPDDMKNAILFWSKYKRTERRIYVNYLLE